MVKTNVMRILDKANIKYDVVEASNYNFINGIEMAKYLNEPCEVCYKTIVTVGKSKNHYVFMLPVDKELDLKKCAKVSGEKSICPIHQKDLLGLTGYIHGGCSPLGMKKLFKTVINDTAILFDYICVSGGKVGLQIQINPEELANYINAIFVDVID